MRCIQQRAVVASAAAAAAAAAVSARLHVGLPRYRLLLTAARQSNRAAAVTLSFTNSTSLWFCVRLHISAFVFKVLIPHSNVLIALVNTVFYGFYFVVVLIYEDSPVLVLIHVKKNITMSLPSPTDQYSAYDTLMHTNLVPNCFTMWQLSTYRF